MARLNADQLVAGVIGVLTGALEADDPRISVARLLLSLLPQDVLSRPQDAARAAHVAAAWVVGELPTLESLDTGEGPASSGNYLRELSYRTLFGVQSARRLGKASLAEKFDTQLAKEAKNYEGHLAASENRVSKRQLIDTLVGEHGNVLSWRAVLDERTTADCAAAHGSNFDVTNPPRIGFPGTVHPFCRCTPAAPLAGATLI